MRTLRDGLMAGLVGSLTIWLYEWVVLHHFLKESTSLGVVQHTALLVFGPAVLSHAVLSFVLGAAIHCATGVTWGIVFALLWTRAKSWGLEASLLALPFGAVAWIVMHVVVLALFSPAPPTYTTYTVINGLMSHMVAFSVPVALCVKALASGRQQMGDARG